MWTSIKEEWERAPLGITLNIVGIAVSFTMGAIGIFLALQSPGQSLSPSPQSDGSVSESAVRSGALLGIAITAFFAPLLAYVSVKMASRQWILGFVFSVFAAIACMSSAIIANGAVERIAPAPDELISGPGVDWPFWATVSIFFAITAEWILDRLVVVFEDASAGDMQVLLPAASIAGLVLWFLAVTLGLELTLRELISS